MTNTVKKIRPLAVLAVLMAFFLTSCDAVLETFYPEFKDGGKLATQTFNFTLNYQTTFNGKIFIKLVPYEFNAIAQKDVAKPESATGTNFSSNGVYDPNSNNGVFSTQLSVLPGKKYRLVAYLESPNASEAGQPNSDLSAAQLVSVNFQDLFTSDDVKQAVQSFGSISGNLQSSSYLPSGVYYELFSTSQSDDAWWVEGPANIDLKDDPNRTSADYSLTRPFSYTLGAISQVKFTIYGPGGVSVIDNYANISNSTSDQFPLDSASGTNLQFNQTGDYNISASYWKSGDNIAGPSSGTVTLTVHVNDTSGGNTGSEYSGGSFSLDVTASGLTSGYGYVYYVDAYGSWNYMGYIDASTGNVLYGATGNYIPRYLGWQDARIVVDAYDTGWNFVGEYDAPNFQLSSSYTSSQTSAITVAIGAPEMANGNQFTMNVNLDTTAYSQFSTYGITDIELYVWDPIGNGSGAYYPYTGSETIYGSGSVYSWTGLGSSFGSSTLFTYHQGNPLTVYIYGNGFSYYLGSVTLPRLTTSDSSYTIDGVSAPIIY